MSGEIDPTAAAERDVALTAAGQASEALTQLLRFVNDGPSTDHFAFEEETIELLADALKMAIAIEDNEERRARRRECFGPGGADEADLLGQLSAALTRFLEGWAG